MRSARIEITDERHLAAICQETLRHWSGAKAAVLFGSRARGTHQEDSDWDVAFVLEGEEPKYARPAGTHRFPQAKGLDELDRVDAWAVGSKYLLDRAADLGTLPYCIIRDGRLLAGAWEAPDPAEIQKDASMKPEDWSLRMEKVLSVITDVMTRVSEIATSRMWRTCVGPCQRLMQNTVDAAELLLKAAMERRGVAADHTHDISQLVESFAKARPDDAELSERMAALNGKSRRDHMAMYESEHPSPEDCQNAVNRLAATLDLWVSETVTGREDAMAGMVQDLADLAFQFADSWKQTVQTPVVNKLQDAGLSQKAASTVLEGREDIDAAVMSFRKRLQELTET